MKPPRLYVPLFVGFSRDPKLRRAGTGPELLFLRGIAYAKENETDGLVPDYDLPVVAVGLNDPEGYAASLVRVGAWEVADGGWRIVAWHRWNEHQEQLDRKREQARQRQARRRDRQTDVTRDSDSDSRGGHANKAEVEVEAEETPHRVGDADDDAPGSALSPVDRIDVERVCKHLADAIAANGSKRPTITKKWRDAARLLIDKDGRTEEQVHACIDWCQADEFWRANVLSMPKLRDKFEQMRLQAARRPGGRRPSPDDKVRDVIALGERMAGGSR
jgi:hypothetical protein